MKPEIYIKSDYAALESKNFTAYYGYEQTSGENEEWCFVASFNNKEIKIPFSKLGATDMFNCGYNLMIGVAWLLMKYKLSL